MSAEPTQDYLLQLLGDIPPLWDGRNRRINEVRAERKHLNPPQAPNEISKLTKLPAPQCHAVEDLLRHTQGLFAAKLPSCTRDPLNPLDPDDKSAAEAVARWVNASHELTLDYPRNVWYQWTDAFGQDGQAVLKDVLYEHRFRPKQTAGEKDDRYLARVAGHRRDPQNFPFVTEHVDTTMYFPVSDDAGEGGPGIRSEVMEVTQREAAPLLRKYEKEIKKAVAMGRVVDSAWGSSSNGPLATWVEYWSRTHFAYMMDGVLLKVGTHKYRRPPYFDPDFSTTSLKDRAHLTEGIADPLVSVQRGIESIDLIFQGWAHFAAIPRFTYIPVNTEDLEPIDPTFQVNLGPFEIAAAPPGYRLQQLELKDIGETLMRWRAALVQEKDDLSLAPILLGKLEQTQGGPTATAMLDVAKSILGVAHGNTRGAFNELARHRLYCVDKILCKNETEKVPIEYYDAEDEGKKHPQWIEIGPKEIQGNYRVSHDVQPVTAAERAIESQLALTLHNNKMVDKAYVLRKSGVPNPEEMLKRWRQEEADNSGPPQQMAIAAGMEMFAAWKAEKMGEIAPPMNTGTGTPEANPAGMSGPFVPEIGGGGTNPGVMDLPRPDMAIGENPAAAVGMEAPVG